MSSSFNSLSDDSNTAITPSTVDTLQIMRFEPPPVDLEEEPTYGPAVREREGGEGEREGEERVKDSETETNRQTYEKPAIFRKLHLFL